MPAAGRVVLYMLAWLLVAQLLAPAVVIGARLLLIHLGGGSWMSRLQEAVGGNILSLGWPTVAGLEWTILGTTAAVTWFFTRKLDRRREPVPGFRPVRPQALHWLLGIVLGGLFIATIFLGGRLAGWYEITGTMAPGQALALLVVATVILLPAAAVEEISMRGYVQRVLEERYGPARAIGVTALIFALLHAGNPAFFSGPGAFVGLILAGVYLGLAYHLTGRLYFPIALHLAWNLFEGPVFGFRVSGMATPSVFRLQQQGPALWTGGEFGPEAGMVLPVALLVHLPLLVYAARWLRRQDEAAWQLTSASGDEAKVATGQP